jgi:hypothetical protein
LRALHVDANGNLSDLGSIEDFSTYIVIDPQNRFLFTNGSSNTVSVYKIADSGAIGAKVGAFQVLPAFNTVFGFVADRTGSFLFIPGNDRIVTERINPDGSLAEASVLMHDFTNIPPADSMAVEPGNRQVVFDWFTSTDPKEIFTLGISSDGKLSATSRASNTGNFGIRGEVDGPGW